MPNNFDVDADIYDGVDFEKLTEDALDAVAVETQETWRDLMDEAGYRNTGEAIRSIAVERPNTFTRLVGSDRIQVLIGEVGREPGSMPPRDPIANWVDEQAGLPSRGDEDFDDTVWGVRKGIEENGLPAYHFAERAVAKSQGLGGELARRVKQEAEEQSVE